MHIHSCSYLWMIIHKVIKNTVYRPKGQLMCSSMRCKQTFFKKKRKEKENDFDQENISTSAIKTWTRSCLEGNMSQCKISLTEVGKTKKKTSLVAKGGAKEGAMSSCVSAFTSLANNLPGFSPKPVYKMISNISDACHFPHSVRVQCFSFLV